jgi:hypothetical protein
MCSGCGLGLTAEGGQHQLFRLAPFDGSHAVSFRVCRGASPAARPRPTGRTGWSWGNDSPSRIEAFHRNSRQLGTCAPHSGNYGRSWPGRPGTPEVHHMAALQPPQASSAGRPAGNGRGRSSYLPQHRQTTWACPSVTDRSGPRPPDPGPGGPGRCAPERQGPVHRVQGQGGSGLPQPTVEHLGRGVVGGARSPGNTASLCWVSRSPAKAQASRKTSMVWRSRSFICPLFVIPSVLGFFPKKRAASSQDIKNHGKITARGVPGVPGAQTQLALEAHPEIALPVQRTLQARRRGPRMPRPDAGPGSTGRSG